MLENLVKATAHGRRWYAPTGQGSGIMVYRGQKYREVGDVRFWEVIEPHPGPGHQDEWFLRTSDSSVVWSVHELDLENQALWVPVRDT